MTSLEENGASCARHVSMVGEGIELSSTCHVRLDSPIEPDGGVTRTVKIGCEL